MSVMGEGSKRVFTAALFQGSLSCMTLAKPAGMGEPDFGLHFDQFPFVRLNFVVSFGANSCIPFTALFSLSILVSELRPVDQIHNFPVWRAVQRESLQ